MGWSFAEAVRELRAAVALNPNYASAHQWLGRVLMDEGWIEESLAELKLASELDPLSSRIMDNRATANVVAGRYREALALYDRALALQPGAAQAQAGKATLLIELGRFDEAVALARGLPEGKMNRATQVVVYARAGLRAEAEALLPEIDPRVLNRATYRLALRDWEGALAALDPAEATAVTAEQLLLGPALDPIRGDARYLKFIAALGLTEAHARAQAWRAKHPPEKTVPEQ